jgi:uncharacterized protein (DUF1697 family)
MTKLSRDRKAKPRPKQTARAARYVALLRAINVGGNNIIKMADLRRAFESLGFANVETHIQSGNVLFASAETSAERLASRLEKGLEASLGYRGSVFVLTPRQLKEAAANNPFDPERLENEQRCHLMFLSREPDEAHCAALMKLQGGDYRFFVQGRVLYYAYPKVSDGSRRRAIDIERVLGAIGTARTWNVVNKLVELA